MARTLFACLVLCLALTAREVGAESASLTQLRSKAEAGDVGAAFELGKRFDYGKGVPKDHKEAAAWYLVAAQGGLAEAQNSLGSLYQAGDGVQQDFSEAMAWYQKAADQHHPEATNNLAYLYDEGKGVPEDNVRAIDLYTKAAELGFVSSMVNLGIMYRDAEGVPADVLEAYKWFDLARFYTQRSKDMQLKWYVRGLYDHLKATMTPGDIAKAEAMSRKWSEARNVKDDA